MFPFKSKASSLCFRQLIAALIFLFNFLTMSFESSAIRIIKITQIVVNSIFFYDLAYNCDTIYKLDMGFLVVGKQKAKRQSIYYKIVLIKVAFQKERGCSQSRWIVINLQTIMEAHVINLFIGMEGRYKQIQMTKKAAYDYDQTIIYVLIYLIIHKCIVQLVIDGYIAPSPYNKLYIIIDPLLLETNA